MDHPRQRLWRIDEATTWTVPVGIVNFKESSGEQRKQNIDVRNALHTRVSLSEESLLPAPEPTSALVGRIDEPQFVCGLIHHYTHGDMFRPVRATLAAAEAIIFAGLEAGSSLPRIQEKAHRPMNETYRHDKCNFRRPTPR